MAEIAWIGISSLAGGIEGTLKFPLVQKNFGETPIHGARRIKQGLQCGNSFRGSSQLFENHRFPEMIPKAWIEALKSDMSRQGFFEQPVGVGRKRPFSPEFGVVWGLLKLVPTGFHGL